MTSGLSGAYSILAVMSLLTGIRGYIRAETRTQIGDVFLEQSLPYTYQLFCLLFRAKRFSVPLTPEDIGMSERKDEKERKS